MSTWLDNILEQHKELESPLNFWRWGALCAISAIVRDNVYMNKHIYKLYPNIFVMLHADSGMKKGPPVNMAKRLVRYADKDYNIISGRSSIQGILARLGESKSAPGGKIINGSNAFICSSELTSSIVSDPAAMEILTDLYDRHYNEGSWKSLLKQERFTLTDPLIVMLTATNEAHANSFFGEKDIQGGYFARTFVIFEKKRNTVNSLMDPPTIVPNYQKLAEYLNEIKKLKGEFEPTPTTTPVGRYYDNWYRDFVHHIDTTKAEDPTGTLNRFGDSVLKVAMLYSLAEEPCLRISMKAMELAIKECEKLIGNIRRTTMGQSKHSWGQLKALVLNELLERQPHSISRLQFMKKYYLHGNTDELHAVMMSLVGAGFVIEEAIGGNIIYTMPNDKVEEWQKHLEGRMK